MRQELDAEVGAEPSDRRGKREGTDGENKSVQRRRDRERGLWLERGARALALGYDEAGARKSLEVRMY
jgi:hypothetical protein